MVVKSKLGRRLLQGLVLMLGIAVICGGLPGLAPVAQAAVSDAVISDLSPNSGETGVPVDESITFRFKEAMTPSSINTDTVYLRKSGSSADVPASVTYDQAMRSCTLEPDADLAMDSSYIVYLTGSIRYENGDRISAQSWQFTTVQEQALIVDKVPAPGKTVTTPEVVSFRFTQEMDRDTVDEDSVYLRDETTDARLNSVVSYSSTTWKVEVDPSNAFISGHRYSVNVTSDVKLMDGTRIAAQSWSFRVSTQTSNDNQAREEGQPQQGQGWMPIPEGMVPVNPGGHVPPGQLKKGVTHYPFVLMDGKNMEFKHGKPYIKNGRAMLPMRDMFEQMGAIVQWDEVQKKVTAAIDGNTIELQIGSKTAYKNGKKVDLDAAAEITDDSTMIPLRFAGEGLGKKVTWDDKNKTVIIGD